MAINSNVRVAKIKHNFAFRGSIEIENKMMISTPKNEKKNSRNCNEL